MLFAAVLFQNPLDLLAGFEGGVGLAAVAVPAMCMLGGYAIAGHGPLWVRGLCGLLTLSAVPIWALTATEVGGAPMSLSDPHGLWAAILYWGLLAMFSMAAAIPHRAPVPPLERRSPRPPRTPSRRRRPHDVVDPSSVDDHHEVPGSGSATADAARTREPGGRNQRHKRIRYTLGLLSRGGERVQLRNGQRWILRY